MASYPTFGLPRESPLRTMKRVFKWSQLGISCLISAVIAGIATPAEANKPTDLNILLVGPGSIAVDSAGHYEVLIENISSRPAKDVQLLIQLPETATSPIAHTMGRLSNMDTRCEHISTFIECDIGLLLQDERTVVAFDIASPYRSKPAEILVEVSTSTREINIENNTHKTTINLDYVSYSIAPEASATVNSCTGKKLTSFYACVVSPSSLMTHTVVLKEDNSLAFPSQAPTYGGRWSQPAADRLVLDYTNNNEVVMHFEGRGIGNACFDGVVTFTEDTYNAAYRVCFQ